MAGQIIRILTRTDYNFTQTTAPPNANTIVIARKIDVSRWREHIGIVRVHAWPGKVAAQTIDLQWANDGFTDHIHHLHRRRHPAGKPNWCARRGGVPGWADPSAAQVHEQWCGSDFHSFHQR